MKKHLKNGKNVSMGFGFVEFDSTETATSVCSDLQVLNKTFEVLGMVVLQRHVLIIFVGLVYRGVFWTVMLLSYNFVMSRMMVKYKRELRKTRVQPSCL